MEKWGTTRARKQRNAVVITLGSKFNINEGQEFYVLKEDDGCISLIPKIEDFFIHTGLFSNQSLPGEVNQKCVP